MGLVVLGVIPARGGSKRVPAKNIRPLRGRPLIAYTIDAAKEATLLTDWLVSTDDPQIAEVARASGGNVPFMRPPELAGDDTPDRPVLAHALKWFEQQHGARPDAVALLRPTTPFKTGALIDAALKKLADSGADSVRSMCRAEASHHPYWMYTLGKDDEAQVWQDGIDVEGKYYRRQLLPPCYRLNGVIDVMRASCILDGDRMYGDDMRILETDELESIDIDSELDFLLCEAVLEQRAGAEAKR